jgi:hypothetical protein
MFKNKNIRTKNVEIKLYYVNIYKHEYERTWQGYGVKLCLRLLLNRLKEMKGPIPIYTPFGT